LGFLELLKEPQLDDLKRTSYMNNVSKSARRLLATITDIVEVSKLESGQSEILLQDVEVNQLMEKQYQLLKPEAEQKGIVMRRVDENQEESLHIQTDKQKLSSILTHLLNNAIKFTEQGYIELGKYLDNGYLVFFVKDTGVGVPVNKMEAIFERFVQADSAVTRGYEGLGLGLSIARAYLELLDGKIWVESEVGRGSTFYFSIPLTPSAQKEKAVSEQRRPPSEHPARHTLLVAEDDDMSYVFLETILEDYALDLHRAVTGEEVIDLLKERPEASLILMDLKMPGMGGLAATREIRKFNTSIPIIAQTAHALTGDKATAINSGCDDYIAKPIKRKELIRMINQYAGGVLQKRKNNSLS
ncbi:MAG: ATP-binding protein, partial [Bacteroidales bacterium]|nr:ATP-binding protein [Bacteroidales bacterium]